MPDTITAPVEPAVPTEAPAVSSPEFQQQVDQTATTLLSECSEIRIRTNWFGTSSKVTDEQALEMLKDSGADRKSVSISKRLLSSKHDALTAVKEARKAIQDHVNAWTVPMLAIRGAGDDGATMRKDAGTRLIQKKDMQTFDERLQYLIGVLMTAVRVLQRALPIIKEEDRARLGKLYQDSDYPEDVTKLVAVEVAYKTTAIDLDWEQMCPAIYERERQQAQAKMNHVVENAAVEFSQRFIKYIQQVVDQLGNRVRLNPTKDSEFLKYKDAEIVECISHEEDPENVPDNHVWVQVRYAGKGGKSITEWLEPMLRRTYEDTLRPYETAERKKLFASSIDNLRLEMDAFLNVGAMLGPYQGIVTDSVNSVREMLTRASRDQNSSKIAEELRSGDYLRNEMRRTLGAAADLVRDNIGEAKKVRRRIDASLIGRIGDD